MTTPLTITTKAWNYCNNNCEYCVSGSNSARWNFDGDFAAIESSERLDFDALLRWIREFTSDCRVHISGGEPLLRPDIETEVEKLVNAGIPCTITTNGMLISKRPAMLTMPLQWIVTYHPHNRFEHWIENAKLIRNKPHIVSALFSGQIPAGALEARYAGFNFCWAKINGLRVIPGWKPRGKDLTCAASEVFHLIEPNGLVYPCNCTSRGAIGDIYMMTYQRGMARKMDRIARMCIRAGLCPAYQTAATEFGRPLPIHGAADSN